MPPPPTHTLMGSSDNTEAESCSSPQKVLFVNEAIRAAFKVGEGPARGRGRGGHRANGGLFCLEP